MARRLPCDWPGHHSGTDGKRETDNRSISDDRQAAAELGARHAWHWAAAYFNRQQYSSSRSRIQACTLPSRKRVERPIRVSVLTYLNEKRLQDAQAAFTDLLAQDSTKAQAHYGLGLVLEDQGKCQAAIEEFKAVLLA